MTGVARVGEMGEPTKDSAPLWGLAVVVVWWFLLVVAVVAAVVV
jgi:hypothetical protein